MKHFKKCSYTILESPPKYKWGVVAKGLAKQNFVYDKNVFRLIVKNRWNDKVERRGVQLAQGSNGILWGNN